MNDMEEPNDWDYGLFSPHWMLKASLMYVPRWQLNLAIVRMIDEMVYGEDEDVDYLDVLAQYALTGRYVKTREHTEEDHNRRFRTQTPTYSEEEIDRQVAEFRKILDGEPSASDSPLDGLSDEQMAKHLADFQEILRNIVPRPEDNGVDSGEDEGKEGDE